MKGLACLTAVAVLCCASASMAADLDLKVTCPGGLIDPEEPVYFVIEGEVSTGDCEGLALFGVDVTVTGPSAIDHDLDIVITAPTGDIATYFVSPGGLTNPVGFGGTPTAAFDSLMQVGGAQNTIHNVNPPEAPTAWPIATGVAQGGFITLAEGSITLPSVDDGTYTITLSDGFGNVLITEHTDPSYWEVAQASIVDAGLSCQFAVGIETPIEILAVAGWVDHGGTERPVEMFGVDPPVEPRLSGVGKVVVDVDVALDPATVIAGNVSVVGVNNPGPYTPDTVTLGGADDVVTIEFNTALPDIDCYTFDLTGMESFDGGGFDPPEDSEFQIVALVADVNRDNQVSTADGSSVKGRLEDPVTDENCQYDVNDDGQISTADRSSVKGRLENAAPTCP